MLCGQPDHIKTPLADVTYPRERHYLTFKNQDSKLGASQTFSFVAYQRGKRVFEAGLAEILGRGSFTGSYARSPKRACVINADHFSDLKSNFLERKIDNCLEFGQIRQLF